MAKLELSQRQIVFILIALKKYEKALLEAEEDDDSGAVEDLLMVQHLQKIFAHAKEME
jgi:hypothetical protein